MNTQYKFWAKKLNIGNTPLVKLPCDSAEIFVKAEQHNLSGSIKDRATLNMVLSLFANGKLAEGGKVVEATSGNTGISLATIAQHMDFTAVLTMPQSMSVERRKMLTDLGAELHLTDAALGMQGAVDRAAQLAKIHNAPQLFQFENLANAEAHFLSTGVEILQQLNGRVPDVFVCGVGTGGTITGVAQRLKMANPNIEIFAVEPAESAVLSGFKAGSHSIQGIGAGFVPKLLSGELITSVHTVTSADAVAMTQKLNFEYGIAVGISSGANLFAAQRLATTTHKNKLIVTVFPDSANRYSFSKAK